MEPANLLVGPSAFGALDQRLVTLATGAPLPPCLLCRVLASFGSVAELKRGLGVTAMQPVMRGSTQANITFQVRAGG